MTIERENTFLWDSHPPFVPARPLTILMSDRLFGGKSEVRLYSYFQGLNSKTRSVGWILSASPRHHTSVPEADQHLLSMESLSWDLAASFIVLGLGAWVTVNGVYQELPYIAQTAPEGYDIFSCVPRIARLPS